MICVILAAGYATRMYPLTENFPKPLLEVGGKAILDWLVDDVSEHGVSGFVVVSNHRFIDRFKAWASGKPQSIVVLDDGSVDNDHRLGAVKDIELAIDRLELDDDLIVLAGDNVLDFSLGAFMDYFTVKRTTCIMRHHQPSQERLRKTGVVEIDSDDLVLSMEEKPAKPKSNWAVPPFYIYRRGDLGLLRKGIDGGCNTDAPGSFIEWLCRRTPVHAMEMPGQRFDVGSIEGYERIRVEYKGVGK